MATDTTPPVRRPVTRTGFARSVPAPVAPSRRPLVIAHRGASGYRPEHTLAAYRLAVLMGADYLEPDLVTTADGVLVARHENEISGTTDVADHPELADRRTTKVVGGRQVTGWFTEDLTLAELRTLRARERLPARRPASARYDGWFPVPTFDEVLELAVRASRRTGRTIGVCPETKHPSHFAALGLPLEEPLLRSLRRHGLDRPGAPVLVQSFEAGNLRRLRATTDLRLLRLVDAVPGDDALVSPAGLREMAAYADVVGVHQQRVLASPGLVADAHAAGLEVHAWTLRDDDPGPEGQSRRQARALLDAGVDGLFGDHPATLVASVDQWLAAQDASA